jgi:hypothetical protein
MGAPTHEQTTHRQSRIQGSSCHGGISGRKTIQEIAADHAIHPIQVSQWKKQLLDGARELFTRGKKSKDKEAGQVTFRKSGTPGLPFRRPASTVAALVH